ncbi:hypothetical protein HY495_01425 [Candidatus Woesearchaeota archaeon]|nr:hypothetical protein [Candidatus Woesearchaeota archaeon]
MNASGLVSELSLPTEEESLRYFADYKVPGNIKSHCLRVREVSHFLAQELRAAGKDVDVLFTDRLGLFHDLFKVVSLSELKPNKFHSYEFSEEEITMWKELRQKYPKMFEGDVAYLIFKDIFPQLALSLKKVSDPRETNLSWEEKIVHYVDWRVFQDQIVSLDERVVYLQERYPRQDNAWTLFITKMKAIEDELFTFLPFPADDLARRLERSVTADE